MWLGHVTVSRDRGKHHRSQLIHSQVNLGSSSIFPGFFSLTFIGTAILFLNLFGRETRNHYELLGVYASASEVEIKNAFRRESLKYHPDKNPNDEYAKERFLKLVDAKETLTDKNKRAEYDAQLERERSRPHPQASYHQNRPPPSTSVFQYLIADSSADCSSVICWYLTIIMQTAATSLSFLGFFRFLFCLAITSVITQLLFPFFLNAWLFRLSASIQVCEVTLSWIPTFYSGKLL